MPRPVSQIVNGYASLVAALDSLPATGGEVLLEPVEYLLPLDVVIRKPNTRLIGIVSGDARPVFRRAPAAAGKPRVSIEAPGAVIMNVVIEGEDGSA